MPRITFIEPGGLRRVIDAPIGISLMEAAVQNGVQGILALCGGACACGTCHVYVDADWLPQLDPREEMEEGMLECAWEPRDFPDDDSLYIWGPPVPPDFGENKEASV